MIFLYVVCCILMLKRVLYVEIIDRDILLPFELSARYFYIDLVPASWDKAIFQIAHVKCHVVFPCRSFFLSIKQEGEARRNGSVWEGIMIYSSVTLADFRGVHKGCVTAYRSPGRYFLVVKGIKGREESTIPGAGNG